MNSYDLTRPFWDWCFSNPEKAKPIHIAIFHFAIEHCNRLGWKKKFGFPTSMAMEAIGIKSYNTYINGLNDLVEWGFIEMIERSKNQHSSNIVALSKYNKAQYKALDKALGKHSTKQHESTVQSNSSIDKPLNKETIKPLNNIVIEDRKLSFAYSLTGYPYSKELLTAFYKYWTEPNKSNTKMRFELQKTWSTELRLQTWSKNETNFKSNQNGKPRNQQTDEGLRSFLED